MATFIFLVKMTDEGVKGMKDTAKRHAGARKLIADLGGEERANYMTMGSYDRVVIIDFPNGEAAAKFSMSMSSKGFMRATTLRGFSPEEAEAIAASVP